jgi:hypothetical protein
MDVEHIETRDEEGRSVSVFKFSTRIDTSDLDGPSWVEGISRYRLSNGAPVNFSGGTFRVVATGKRLKRV